MHQNLFYIDHLQSFSDHSCLGTISEKVNRHDRQRSTAETRGRRFRCRRRSCPGDRKTGRCISARCKNWPAVAPFQPSTRPLSPPNTEEMGPPEQSRDRGRVAAGEEAAPALLSPLWGCPPGHPQRCHTSGHSCWCSYHLNCTSPDWLFYRAFSH